MAQKSQIRDKPSRKVRHIELSGIYDKSLELVHDNGQGQKLRLTLHCTDTKGNRVTVALTLKNHEWINGVGTELLRDGRAALGAEDHPRWHGTPRGGA